ncbi:MULTISPECIES: DUF2147 domain-containing protein [Emticicia]|uniref:DUF2147 domain-containing protein n=1 Tax=Emticicia TaxID=312278 RepID=UPI0007D89D0E|nr:MULTISPECIES: DUF2147 domain-containing protein [Emticicia]
MYNYFKKVFLVVIIVANGIVLNAQDYKQQDEILGTWISENKDLKVEIYKKEDKYFGKIIWFLCDPKTPNMSDFKDTENPEPKLRHRPWLGMEVVEGLMFNGDNIWGNGTIYDPNTGRTYSSVVTLKDNNTLVVKGYWGIELLGKNMIFYRVVPSGK